MYDEEDGKKDNQVIFSKIGIGNKNGIRNFIKLIITIIRYVT